MAVLYAHLVRIAFKRQLVIGSRCVPFGAPGDLLFTCLVIIC